MLPEAVRSGAVPFALAHDGLDMHQVPSDSTFRVYIPVGLTNSNVKHCSLIFCLFCKETAVGQEIGLS